MLKIIQLSSSLSEVSFFVNFNYIILIISQTMFQQKYFNVTYMGRQQQTLKISFMHMFTFHQFICTCYSSIK